MIRALNAYRHSREYEPTGPEKARFSVTTILYQVRSLFEMEVHPRQIPELFQCLDFALRKYGFALCEASHKEVVVFSLSWALNSALIPGKYFSGTSEATPQ